MAGTTLTRRELAEFLPNQRSIRAFEETFETVAENTEGVESAQQTAEQAEQAAQGAQQAADEAIAATNSIKDATLLVLSPDTTLMNERVLTAGNLIDFDDTGAGGTLTIKVDKLTIAGAFTLGLTLTGNTTLTMPTAGTLATLAGTEALSNKTLDQARVQSSFTAGTPTATGSVPIVVNGVTKYIMLADAP